MIEQSPTSVRLSRHRLDWSNRPTLYRTYPGAETIPLPNPRKLMRPALEVIAVPTPSSPTSVPALDLDVLGTILFLSGGITGTRPSSGGDIRATAAAGALYPNELYIVTGDLVNLAAGVYHYDPKRERLSRLRSGDWRAALGTATADERPLRTPATLVLTGIHWRSAWKYEDRGYRHLYWDGGMKLAHILAAAEAAGHPAVVLTGFVDRQVDGLLGIDGHREVSLALVPLGAKGVPAPAVSGSILPMALEPSPLSTQPIDYPEVLRYHNASRLKDEAAVRDFRSGKIRRGHPPLSPQQEFIQLPSAVPAHSNASLDTVVRRRRSTRRFARKPITAVQLATVLKLPTRGFPVDVRTTGRTLLETYVLVHAVRDIPPGAYYFDPDGSRLVLLQEREMRAVAGLVCLNQDLARDASAVIYYLADLEAVFTAYGERGYRIAELEAGLVAGWAYLAAYSTGLGATGLTFFDKEAGRLFLPHARGLEVMLAVAVGVPAKRH